VLNVSAEPPPAIRRGWFPALRTTNDPPPEPPYRVPDDGAAPTCPQTMVITSPFTRETRPLTIAPLPTPPEPSPL